MQIFIRHTILFLSLLLISQLAFAQKWEWDWAKVSIPKPYYTTEIANDTAGNVYMLHSGSNSISITKMDTSGNIKLHKEFPQITPVVGQGIVTDQLGNIYIAGLYPMKHLTFGSFTLQSHYDAYYDPNSIDLYGKWDLFMLKLDVLGNVVWAKNIAGPEDKYSTTYLNIDRQGNLLLSGVIRNGADYMGETQDPYDQSTHFVAKISSNNGNIIWSTKVGHYRCTGIDSDAQGNVYVLGDGYTYLSDNSSSLIKLDADGKFVWYKNVGGEGYALVCDDDGNAYVSGMFDNATDMGNGIVLPNVENGVMLVKYDTNAKTLWARSSGGGGMWDFRFAFDLDIDKQGRVYVIGKYSPPITFGFTTLNSDPSSIAVFVACYNDYGSFRWAKSIEEVTGEILGKSLRVSSTPEGELYVLVENPTTMNFDGLIVNDNSGHYLIARLKILSKGFSIANLKVDPDAIKCFPCWPSDIWKDFEYRFWPEWETVRTATYRNAFDGRHEDEVYWERDETLAIKLNEKNLKTGAYQFQLRALSEEGKTSEWTDAVTFSVKNNTTEIFPNPMKDILNIHYQGVDNEIVSIMFMNSMGRLIHSEERKANEGLNEWQVEVLSVSSADNPLTLQLNSNMQNSERWQLYRE